MQLSEKIADYVLSVKYEQIPEDVVHFTKLAILDYFSSAIAGTVHEPVKIVEDLVKEMGGAEQATTITGHRNSVLNVALYNGAAGHIIELDDIHKASIVHAATVVIPPALAIAEWKGLSGKDLIEAVIVGYEIAFRIGEAVSPSHYYYFHNTATIGTFGAAMATAKLLGLTKEEIVSSLGSAGTQAAGLWEFIEDGAMSKQLHTAKASMNGLLSSLLAKRGFTAAKQIIEGRRGFANAMSEVHDLTKITNGLGEQHKIVENSYKIHSSCRHTHSAMDLAIQFNEEGVNVDEVKEINVGAYQVALNITDNNDPQTIYEGKFSLQYCVALALTTGKGNIRMFTEENLWDEKIREVMKKVNVAVDPEIENKYPVEWGAKIEIVDGSGNATVKQTNYPKGDPENPVNEADLVEKFKILTDNMEEVKRDKLIEQLLHLEDVKSIEAIMQTFRN